MHTALSYEEGDWRDVADLDEISDLIAIPHALVWLDLEYPTREELVVLEHEFGFHKLAIEDVQVGHQRPKIDRYDDFYFVVMYSVSYEVPATKDKEGLVSSEVDIFLGKNYVITAHMGHVAEIDEAIARLRDNPEIVPRDSVGLLFYTICDSLVDGCFPVMDAMEEVIDQMEEKIFVAFQEETIGDIFALRKDLLALRKIVGPERDVFNILIRRDLPVLDGAQAVYFADVYDHLLRIMDMIDTYRDLLSGVLDGYLSATSNNLNQIMKVLTAASILLMSVSLVTGFYGMNFGVMPELGWPIGELWAFGLMVVIGLILFVVFRRRKWL